MTNSGDKHYKHDSLIGTQVGKWSVLSFNRTEKGFRYYNCVCECGNTNSVRGRELECENSRSCGCWSGMYTREKVFQLNFASIKNRLFRSYQRHANDRGYSFYLSKEQFVEIIEKNCNYCGSGPSNTATDKLHIQDVSYKYNGVDRKDNLSGYHTENVVPCCKQCNWAKQKYTTEEFLSWSRRLYNHSINNGYN